MGALTKGARKLQAVLAPRLIDSKSLDKTSIDLGKEYDPVVSAPPKVRLVGTSLYSKDKLSYSPAVSVHLPARTRSTATADGKRTDRALANDSVRRQMI